MLAQNQAEISQSLPQHVLNSVPNDGAGFMPAVQVSTYGSAVAPLDCRGILPVKESDLQLKSFRDNLLGQLSKVQEMDTILVVGKHKRQPVQTRS